MSFRLLPWLRFLRLPNLLTVPGDLFAGAVLVGLPAESALPVLPSLCLSYLFGMALNDVVDLPGDKRERPERPLPSGAISLTSARVVTLLLALAAFLTHPSLPIFLLLTTIGAYSFLKNPFPFVAAPLMAACRGQALWIGAGSPTLLPLPLLFGLLFWMGYIAAVTLLASHETRSVSRTRIPLFLSVASLAAFVATLFTPPDSAPFWLALLPASLFLWGLLHTQRRIGTQGSVHPRDIGRYICLLFPLQAFVLCRANQPIPALLVLSGFPILWLLRRVIPAS